MIAVGASGRARSSQAGMTLLEVLVALVILSTCALPLLIALGDAQRQIARAHNRRVMKQLLEYKLSHILLDKPAEGVEPIYVDGAEGNFGDDFANDPDKAYWFDESLYNYAYRIDSEEIDLGSGGGTTGFEENRDEREREREREREEARSRDPGGSPFGEGELPPEEDLGQTRYRVTLTVFYRSGNVHFDQAISLVAYVKHPHDKESMTGPDLSGPSGALGGAGGIGGNEATPGAGNPLQGITSGGSGADLLGGAR